MPTTRDPKTDPAPAQPTEAHDSTRQNLPLVALRETVIFPEMIVPLQVGREKSVAALNAAVADGTPIVLVTQRRAEKEDIESRLRELPPPTNDTDTDDLEAALARVPDLTRALQEAPPALKRQIFDAFELRIVHDKISRRIEISATVSEAIATTLQNANDLPEEVANVTHKDIAGAGFEPATFGL